MIALIVNAQLIMLMSSHTYQPTIERDGYANIEQWFDGTLIYAHNYLSGGEFYNADIVTAIYADGTTKQFVVTRTAVIDGADWEAGLLAYSTPETLTLATCYPERAVNTSLRYLAEFTEVLDVSKVYTIAQGLQAV